MGDQSSSDELGAAVPSPVDTPRTGFSISKRTLATLLVILVMIGGTAAMVFAMAMSAWSFGDTAPGTDPTATVGAVVIVFIVVGGSILLRWIWRDKRE
jgi:hypothetical protein